MPEKDGDESKSTKSVVNKKQKQMMGEEGYDIARDMGRVRPSKDKKDATTMPPSKEMEKTRKVYKGPSALELIKKKYKGQIMDVKKEELDLTQVAEAFGGYIVEAPKDKTLDDIMRQQGVPRGGVNPEIAQGSLNIGNEYLKNKNPRKKRSDSGTRRNPRNTTSNDPNQQSLNLDTSQGVRDEISSNLGRRAQQDAAQDALLDVINQPNQPSKRVKAPITGDSGQRDRPRVTGDVQTIKKRVPRKGVDYFFDPKKAAAERERVAAKRLEYEIDDKGNVTDAGVEKFARKSLNRKQIASGSNEPIKLSKSDLATAREKLVGGTEVKDSKGNVIGTTTGKYGGRMSKQMSSKNLQKLRTKLKTQDLTKSFTGDKPPTKDDVKPKPDRVTTGDGSVDIPSPKGSLLSRIRKAGVGVVKNVAKSPVAPLIGYDLGKGIVSKIDQVMFPPVRGGRAGTRTAGSFTAS